MYLQYGRKSKHANWHIYQKLWRITAEPEKEIIVSWKPWCDRIELDDFDMSVVLTTVNEIYEIKI